MAAPRSLHRPASRLGRTTLRFAAIALAPVVVVGCNKSRNTPASAEPAASAQSAGSAQPATAKGAASFRDARFNLQIEPKGSYKSGQAGQVQIVLSAKAPFHCNDKYPYKFKLQDSAGVKYPARIVKKDAVQLEKHRATMTVGFTPESAGKKTIAGLFLFSLCSADKCLVERRNLQIDVNVD